MAQKDFRHDPVAHRKATEDIGRVADEIIGHLTRMQNGTEPVMSVAKGVMFATVRNTDAELKGNVQGLIERVKAVKDLAQTGSHQLSTQDSDASAAAQRAAQPGAVGGVPVNYPVQA